MPLLNKKERETRRALIRGALSGEGVLDAVVELVEAELADDDINNDEAHERVHAAVRTLCAQLGYGPDEVD